MLSAGYRTAIGFGVATLLLPQWASADVYSYVDWTAANVAEGTAEGTITLPDDSTVQVGFAAINENGSPGSLYGAQITEGTNFWSPDAPYLSAEVENAPPTPDILQLQGGQNQTYRVTLSEPIKDPIMAIVSLGQASVRTTYDFDSPFTIVSQGAGYWGGSADALKALDGDILEGYEGHGTIRFLGTFSTFSWTVPTPEGWHGFTFGIRTTERLEPSDGGAGAGGDSGLGGESNAGGSPASGGASGGAAGDSAAGGDVSAAGAAENGGTAASEGGHDAGDAGGDSGRAGDAGGDSGRAGDDDGPRAQTRDDPGCNCSLPGRSLGFPSAAAALLLVSAAIRRLRRRSRTPRAAT